jgi:hypothetical protein
MGEKHIKPGDIEESQNCLQPEEFCKEAIRESSTRSDARQLTAGREPSETSIGYDQT